MSSKKLVFKQNGDLNPGVYELSEKQLYKEFGETNDWRKLQMLNYQKITSIFDACGVKKVYIDGSFISKETQPKDIDYIIELPDNFDWNSQLAVILRSKQIMKTQYHADILPYAESDLDMKNVCLKLFTHDRNDYEKGIVRVKK